VEGQGSVENGEVSEFPDVTGKENAHMSPVHSISQEWKKSLDDRAGYYYMKYWEASL
jgi:hypothetical protein